MFATFLRDPAFLPPPRHLVLHFQCLRKYYCESENFKPCPRLGLRDLMRRLAVRRHFVQMGWLSFRYWRRIADVKGVTPLPCSGVLVVKEKMRSSELFLLVGDRKGIRPQKLLLQFLFNLIWLLTGSPGKMAVKTECMCGGRGMAVLACPQSVYCTNIILSLCQRCYQDQGVRNQDQTG